MAHGYKTTEFIVTAVSAAFGLGLASLGASLAIEGARADRHELALVGLGLCFIGAALVGVLAFAYAHSRGSAKSPPARVFAGRV